jgi:hypothetical protein
MFAARIAAAVTAGLAAGAVAAGATPTPKVLGLRVSDFPAGAKAASIIDVSGQVKAYSAAFNFKARGREEEVTELVVVSRSPTSATSQYASYAQMAQDVHRAAPLRLPGYGDEQSANWASYTAPGGARRARAALVVRTNTVVWSLTVENCSVVSYSDCVFGSTPPPISRSQAVAELKLYAVKLRTRVGAG